MKLRLTLRLRIIPIVLCAGLSACGGGDSGESNREFCLLSDPKIRFGGATCGSGISLNQVSGQGIDVLYNFCKQSNPPVRFVLNPAMNAPECQRVLRAVEVFPWIRMDRNLASVEGAFSLMTPDWRSATTENRLHLWGKAFSLPYDSSSGDS